VSKSHLNEDVIEKYVEEEWSCERPLGKFPITAGFLHNDTCCIYNFSFDMPYA
jgi:hypothetical protein